jgi:hypothetical protein
MYAQKPKKAAPAANVRITEATSRRTVPGRKEGDIHTEYRFAMVWNSSTPPTSLFFRPDAKSWMAVQVARPERTPMFPGSADYRTLERLINPKDIHKGDNIIITTRHEHGSQLVPLSIRSMPTQSLYYQTKGSGWKTIKVPNLTKLPDIVLP